MNKNFTKIGDKVMTMQKVQIQDGIRNEQELIAASLVFKKGWQK